MRSIKGVTEGGKGVKRGSVVFWCPYIGAIPCRGESTDVRTGLENNS